MQALEFAATAPPGKMTPIQVFLGGRSDADSPPERQRLSGMDDSNENAKLNSSQRRHLLSSCQYADRLLSEIEAVLTASESKSPFPKFQADISQAQAKVIRDYIARMRSQVVRILEGQGVPIPAPVLGSLHSIRVTLGFVDIAFDECRPKRMAGYGEVTETASTEVSGLVDEMQAIISRLDSYLAQGQASDLEKRLQRLEQAGGDIGLVQTIERAISRHGLVEFRPALATIIDKLELESFEIAVFGRVSSGKSSLLNHIVGQDVLPVGVNPITAVPTRLEYGSKPSAIACFADRKPEQFGLERLAEFVTEQQNPANVQHVTRIVVKLPAPRLREGIVYVDTPGLGSLATSGAAETKAYLPRCDLGVVLIDAGSTLTLDDLATLQTLYDAAIPASVLLSKADVLSEVECERARQYVADHIQSDLGLRLPVHRVSTKTGYTDLLDRWLESEILPLYDRHAELARQSLNRKIGALRLGVEAALQARLRRTASAGRPATEVDTTNLRELEAELRTAAGKIAQALTKCVDMTETFSDCARDIIRICAENLTELGVSRRASLANETLIRPKLEQVAAEGSAQIVASIKEVALNAGRALAKTAKGIHLAHRPADDELLEVIKNMPRFDLGNLQIKMAPSPVASLLGRRWTTWRIERCVRAQAGEQIHDAVKIHARLIQAWVRKTFTELQERFDSYADAYRAQLDRLLTNQPASVEDEEGLRDDLAALAAVRPEAFQQELPSTPV